MARIVPRIICLLFGHVGLQQQTTVASWTPPRCPSCSFVVKEV